MLKIVKTALAVMVMFGAVQTAEALTCRWPALPAAAAIYPAGKGTVVPRNGMIFVRSLLSIRDFKLVDMRSKRRIAILGSRSKLTKMLIIRPSRPLAGNRAFELRVRKPIGGLRPGIYPAGVLVRFTTSSALESVQPPKLKKPVVRFSPVRRGRWVGVGRGATVLVRARSTPYPVVVEVASEFRAVKGTRSIRRFFTRAYIHPRTGITVASMGKCSRIRKAPPSGRYGVTVVPWTVTGKRGRAVVRAGRIK